MSMGYSWKTPNKGKRVWGYIYLLEKTPWNFWNLSLYSEKTCFHSCKFCRIVWHSFRFSTHCFTKVPWLSLTFWNSSSLIFPDSFLSLNYKVHTFFRSLNPRSLKEIQGENLHNFKEILLMMYVYHKGAFTLKQVSLLPNMMPDECALTLRTSWWTYLEAYIAVCRHFH